MVSFLRDCKKISFIYGLMLFISMALMYHKRVSDPNVIILSLTEIILMIVLFKILSVSKKSIIIFFSIFTAFMIMLSVDIKPLFSEYGKYGMYAHKLIFPFEVDLILSIITSPFLGVFVFLKQYSILDLAYYIVPSFMMLLCILSIYILKAFERKHKFKL